MPYIGKTNTTFTTFTTSDANVTDDLTVTDDATIGGDLGIGNTSPSQRLDVQESTVNKGMLVYNTNTTSGASVPVFLASESDGSTTNVSIENASAGTLMLRTGATAKGSYGTSRMQIDGSGNVVFNEDSADADFRIESNGNTNAFVIDADKGVVSIGNDADYAWRNNNGDQQMDISTFGCLYAQGGGSLIVASNWFRASDNTITAKETGVSTGYFGEGVSGGNHVFFTGASASAGAAITFTERFKIALNGDLTGTDTSIASNSDIRLKENIEDYSYDINKVKAMQVKQFDWKEKNLHATPTGQIGFIAQELEEIEPKFVRENEQKENSAELKYLDEDGMAKTSVLGEKDAMYISIIQQLIARIEKLEDK